jgi:hypothetical protein
LEIKFTPDYEAGKPIFLSVFKELAKDNNGLVHYEKLHESLVSTGKFFVGEAVLMIEHTYDTALNIINDWLSKCGKSRQLDRDFNYLVRPLKLESLKLRNKMLYNLVK